jgi:hypothetical protein
MAISYKSIKILWAAAAGRCTFADCRIPLTYSEAREFAPYTLGEMAHICGDQPGANRHDPTQTPQKRDDYTNLILLCPTHHALIDRKENEERFPVEWLLHAKADHEAFVRARLSAKNETGKVAMTREIAALLAYNHESWLQYGPRSELARKNPHSEAAHAVWLSERLSTIVPNNRRICELLGELRHSFIGECQAIIARFQLHVRSYERWVEDELPYAAVTQFPGAFEAMIREKVDAGT